ncbi:MAG: DUF421 domain-containing protein [Syntrophomonadaceae bacterium]|jgi:uncharacterized membrane protein YcaP (DUF421 family)
MNEALVVVVRSLIAFATLLIFTRTLGRQQLSQLTFFDYVLGITIGSIAATLSVDLSSRAWPHWVGLFIWAAVVALLQRVTIHWKQADRYLSGEPVVVIMKGQVLEKNLKTTNYTLSDLLVQLRNKDVFDLTRVDFAVLETNGNLSIQLKPEYQTVTRQDLNIATSAEGVSTEVVYSGLVLEENLKKVGVGQKWLMKQLKAQGIKRPDEVFLATYNPTSGVLFVDKYQDR